MIFKYLDYYHLYLSAKCIPRDTSFFKTILFKYMLLEIFLVLLHPNILVKDIKFITSTTWNLKESNLYVNDILVATTVLRFYLIFWSLISITRYYSARCDRVR